MEETQFTQTLSRRKRISYADIARLCAAFAVVLLHSCGLRLAFVEPGSEEFTWAVIYDCFARWTVPLFIMLSGMLFLNNKKQLNIKKLYTKNILRLVTAFIFWSYVYNLHSDFVYGSGMKSFLTAFTKIPQGALHLWFVFVIVGLYIALPAIKSMTDNMSKRTMEYFLVLNFILTFLVNSLNIFKPFAFLSPYLKNFEILFATGYVGLFILGKYVADYEHSTKFKAVIYGLSVISFVYMTIMTIVYSQNEGKLIDSFMSFKGVSAYLMAFGVMLLLKDIFAKRTFKKRTESNLGHYANFTFGIYLIHELIMTVAGEKFFFFPTLPFIGIPLQALVVFVISFLCCAIIDLLPFGKYII